MTDVTGASFSNFIASLKLSGSSRRPNITFS